MSPRSDDLERLFSRSLDGECTSAEADFLRDLLANDRDARAAFREMQDLDVNLRIAMREALGRPTGGSLGRASRVRAARAVALAAAAVLAAVVWLHPTDRTVPQAGNPTQASAAGSWFAPISPARDTVEPVPVSYERPALRVRGTQRNWILVPGEQPGTYLVIEVERVRTHVIGVHRDF